MEGHTTSDEMGSTTERRGCSKVRLTVEPLGFLYFSSIIVQAIVVQNLFLQKTCRVNFHLNASACAPHNHTTTTTLHHDDDDIQRYVTNLSMCASLIENIPSVLIVLFLGPWSDRNGRKLSMMFPLIGLVLATLTYVLNYWFESWPAEYLLFASVPIGLSGGSAALFMSINSYIADVSTAETRTSRISLLYGFITVSLPVSMFSSIYIYTYGGYIAIWGTSLGLAAIAFIYLSFFVTDTRSSLKEKDEGALQDRSGRSAAAALDGSAIENLWKCFTVTFQKRTGYKRASMCLLLVAMSLYVFSSVPGTVSYLYVRRMFDWDQPEYALFTTIVSIITVLGSFLLLPLLSSYFKVRDSVVGMIAIGGNIFAYIFQGFAVAPHMFYIGSTGFVLSTAIGVVIRSMLSKTVPANELSHVYSVLAAFESIVPLMSSPAFSLLYESTLAAFPGCIYLFASGVLSVALILILIVFLLQVAESQLAVPYSQLESESVVEIF